MKLRNHPCAYCGTTDTRRTKGHVIPRSIYPDSLPQARRIIVPECDHCKARWEDAEPHFRNTMIAIWDPDRVVKDNRYESMKRSLSKCDGPRRWRDFTDQVVSADTPTGQTEKIYPGKDPRCNLILRRIVRGLCHFHELDSAIADERVRCDGTRSMFPESFHADFTWYVISTDFCRYGYSIVGDETLHSCWSIRFSRHIEFFGAIAAGPHSVQPPS